MKNIMSFTWIAQFLGVPSKYFPLFYVLATAFIVMILLLKGLALWRAARQDQKIWFWALLFINTLGILEVIYLLSHHEQTNQSDPQSF